MAIVATPLVDQLIPPAAMLVALGVIIKAFPSWTARAGTGRSVESPDGAIAVALIYAVATGNDLRGARVVIQHFPTQVEPEVV